MIDVPEPEDQRPVPRGGKDRTIAATCQIHGSRGFCNLRLTKVDGEIVLDPHVAGSCVITLNETAATALLTCSGNGSDEHAGLGATWRSGRP